MAWRRTPEVPRAPSSAPQPLSLARDHRALPLTSLASLLEVVAVLDRLVENLGELGVCAVEHLVARRLHRPALALALARVRLRREHQLVSLLREVNLPDPLALGLRAAEAGALSDATHARRAAACAARGRSP